MLKDQYLQTIIGNLGIAISPENNSEIIIKLDVLYDKKSDVFTLSNEYKIFYQDYGTIITDFQNTDFSNKENLIEFFNKYCLFGLENKKLTSLFKDGKCSSSIYNSFVEKMVKKYKKSLISYQKDINSILDYCVFSPNKKTANLTPFERLCILEYLPDKPSLLQSNSLQIIRLNTLSDVDDSNCTELELVNLIKYKQCTAYSNSLYIPKNIDFYNLNIVYKKIIF